MLWKCWPLLHVGCFAHILNLASQAALKVVRLLGRVRHITSFFHRSTTASHKLKEKQRLLGLPVHKLVTDVVTRWNSTVEMLDRFLEQQPAISAALLSSEVHRNEKDLCTLTEADITVAEDVVKALQPLKAATLVMSEERSPTLPVIAPLHAQLLDQMSCLSLMPREDFFINMFQKTLFITLSCLSVICNSEPFSNILCDISSL